MERVLARGKEGEHPPSPSGKPDDVTTLEPSPKREREVRCRACGHVVTTTSARIDVDGAHRHERVNPSGLLFRIACFRGAPGCVAHGEASTFWSWFPGYSWTIALCSGCHAHLGWSFARDEGGFHGLIVERLRDDDEA